MRAPVETFAVVSVIPCTDVRILPRRSTPFLNDETLSSRNPKHVALCIITRNPHPTENVYPLPQSAPDPIASAQEIYRSAITRPNHNIT